MFEMAEIHTDLIIIFRIILAIILAFIPGMERELTGKFAGLRTHILVCVGACVFTILSLYGFQFSIHTQGVMVQDDPARIAAQVITGIGFIGAGTVLRNGPIVLGLTTASTLWIAASIGMACGAGMFDIAFAGTAMAILTLVMVRVFEKNVLPSSTKRTRLVKIGIVCANDYAQTVQDFIIEKYQDISEIKKRTLNADEKSTKITCVLNVIDKKPIKDLYKSFQSLKEIDSISIQEYNEAQI